MVDWKALRNELQESAYLAPDDDLSTQRGIVATAIAILERMSIETRDTSWRPYRLLVKADKALAVSAAVALVAPSASPSGGKASPNGGQRVFSQPLPVEPRPGGAAVRVPPLGIDVW